MADYQISIALLSNRIDELENFKEMILKNNPDLSNKLSVYKEEKRREECEECCNCCKNFLKICFVLFAIYIVYWMVINDKKH